MTLLEPPEEPAEPWFPKGILATKADLIERRELVSRALYRSIVEALGHDPDTVDAIWFDRFTCTVIRKRRPPLRIPIEPEAPT